MPIPYDMKERVKLSHFAKNQGITYQAAWKMWEKGLLDGIKLPSGTILVSGWARSATENPRVVIYVRVNDPKYNDSIPEQIKEAEEFATDKNYEIVDVVYETVRGIDYSRPKLIEVLHRDNWDILLIKDRRTISYIGYDLFSAALGQSRSIETINEVEVDEEAMKELFQRILNWSRQILGMGSQKKAILDLMRKINY